MEQHSEDQNKAKKRGRNADQAASSNGTPMARDALDPIMIGRNAVFVATYLFCHN